MSAPVPCIPLVTLLHDKKQTCHRQVHNFGVRNKGDEAWLQFPALASITYQLTYYD